MLSAMLKSRWYTLPPFSSFKPACAEGTNPSLKMERSSQGVSNGSTAGGGVVDGEGGVAGGVGNAHETAIRHRLSKEAQIRLILFAVLHQSPELFGASENGERVSRVKR